jgi:ankyrin repeat protein
MLVDATTENGTAALHMAARQAHVRVVATLLGAGAAVATLDLGGQTPLGAAFDGLQAVAKYVEEALQEYATTADRKLGNDMLSRAAAAHIEVMEMLLGKGAEPSLIDKDGDTVDANNIVQMYKQLAKGGADADGGKDEL